jgi:predicted Zn-dependent peptidase
MKDASGLPALLVRTMPHRQTIMAGVWISHGSAHDPEQMAGATHLVEHLTLRRCGDHDRPSLARLVDRLGGAVDAWTTSELMGVTVQTTVDALDEALGLLCDSVLEPTFARSDVVLERRIALAELDLVHDDPAEQAEEALLRASWGEHPLSRPVIGVPSALRRLGSRALRRHHKDLIAPGRVLAAVVGDVDAALVAERLARLPLASPPSPPPLPPLEWIGDRIAVTRDNADQVHVRLGFPAPGAGDSRIAALTVLNRLLGGGASSRLFQRLREDAGLTYDIWSGLALRNLGGLLEIGWACSPEVYARTHQLVIEQLQRLPDTVTEEEVAVAREAHLRALRMDAETPAGLCLLEVAEYLERGQRFDHQRAEQEVLGVTLEAVRDLAAELVRAQHMALATCGPDGLAKRVA